jgi:hypothetical protein
MKIRRTIEKRWHCTSCDTRDISGLTKACPSCGNPREDKELKNGTFGTRDPRTSRVVDAVEVRSAEGKDIARAGADWYCPCDAGNRGDAKACVKCGRPRVDDTHPDSPPTPPPRKVTPPPRQAPPPLRAPQQVDWDTTPPRTKTAAGVLVSFGGILAMIGGAFAILFIGYGIWWAFQTHDVAGKVTDMTWRRDIGVDTWTKVTHSTWRDEIPKSSSRMPHNGVGEYAGADNIRGCFDKYYTTVQEECGTETKCSDCDHRYKVRDDCSRPINCHVIDNGNGTGEEECDCTPIYDYRHDEDCKDVKKYCDRKIYKQYCDFDTYEWRHSRVKTADGRGVDGIRWPDVNETSMERLSRNESYVVKISYEGETYSHYLNEREYRTWNVGDPVILAITNLGTVSQVKRFGGVENGR